MSCWDELEARLTAPVSERMLELAEIAPGMRALDLATGKGEPLLRMAARVGAGGHVVGVDPWAEALEVTRAKAGELGLGNVSLQAVGAEAFEVEDASFDAATSRWGLFSSPDPVEALRRVARALRPGAPLVVALWAEYERIPWYSLPREVTARFLDLPPLDSGRPGPLRLSTMELVERDFGAADLAVERVEEMECTVVEAEEILGWARHFLGRWVEALPTSQVGAWEQALAGAAEAYRREGLIRLGGVTRLVLARTGS